ncbi:MAG: hypothetical protein ACI4JB_03595 [Porcipelethomonas sp.]
MKSYEEMARCVLERRDRQLEIKHRRRMTVLKSLTAASSVCLAVLLSFGAWKLSETKNEFIYPDIDSTIRTEISDKTDTTYNTTVSPDIYETVQDTDPAVPDRDEYEDDSQVFGPPVMPGRNTVTTVLVNSSDEKQNGSAATVTSVSTAKPSLITTAPISHAKPPATKPHTTVNIPSVLTTAASVVTYPSSPSVTSADEADIDVDNPDAPGYEPTEPDDSDESLPAVTTMISYPTYDEPCAPTLPPPTEAETSTTTTTTTTVSPAASTTVTVSVSQTSFNIETYISVDVLPRNADTEKNLPCYAYLVSGYRVKKR